jgi:Tol biopolymer transport system component
LDAIAHFRILGVIGGGGMGVVYRAHDELLRRDVALKVLPDPGNEERRQRFLREARSAAGISHPNVAVVHQVGEDGGQVYIAMELVDGESLRQRLERGPLDVATALDIAAQVARGLAAAHQKDIVHRDLKPENVMVTPAGVVKLLDFGLAKPATTRPAGLQSDSALAKTQTVVTSDEGRIMGTPEYMSPEQAMGEPLDVRSDVFSFGIVLYEMLSGRRPFGGDTAGSVLVAIARDPAPPLRPAARALDERTETIVQTCLAKAPAARFASAAEIVQALSASVSPRAASLSMAAVPLNARRRAAAGPLAKRLAFFLAVAIVLGLGGWWLVRPQPVRPVAATASAAVVDPPRATYVARRLTYNPADDGVFSAALTPDGKTLVFGDVEGVWAQPVDGGARRALGVPFHRGEIPGQLSVFPDSSRVRVSLHRGPHATHYVAPLDGSPASVVGTGAADTTYASPDGALLAIWRMDGELGIESPSSGGWTHVASTGLWGYESEVSWSPDGRRIAFVGASDLVVASADGGQTSRVWSDPSLAMGGFSAVAWSRVDRIVFGGAVGPEVVLREIAVDSSGRATSAPTELWRGAGVGLSDLTIVGGRMSVLISRSNNLDVVLARLAPRATRLDGAPQRLSRSDAVDKDPDWLPDGRVVYYSERSLEGALFAQAPGAVDAVPLVDGPVLHRSLTSLRTGALLYARPISDSGDGAPKAPGEERFVLRRGLEEREILRTSSGAQVRCGARDIARCVLRSRDGGGWSYSRFDLASGRIEPPFYRAGPLVRGFAVFPDGGSIVVASHGPNLAVVRVADGATRTLTTSPTAQLIQEVAFTSDGQGLIFTGMQFEGALYGMAHVNLDGKGDMLLSSSNTWLSSPAVSPDGKWLAFDERAENSDVWLVETVQGVTTR